MTGASLRRSLLLAPLIACLTSNLPAQEAEELACEPDEIDMGDYCAERPPEAARLKPGARRATPFRVKGMMPGRVGESPGLPRGQPRRPDTADEMAPDLETGGFGVQLGVFSTRDKAEQVARQAAVVVGGPFALARIERDAGILWACIHGPFPDQPTAVEAQRRLRRETPFGDAFVKPLDETEPLDLEHASTEK